MHRVGQNGIYTHTVYDRIFGDFPAKNTVYTPYIYIYIYIYMVLANPTYDAQLRHAAAGLYTRDQRSSRRLHLRHCL